MSVVALTGGIGTGKSTVLGLFAALGARTASGDAIAREVFDDPQVQQLLHDRLGLPLPVQRQAVADLVFKDHHALTELEDITHPRIAATFDELRRTVGPSEVLVYEYPLLPDAAAFDHVIAVSAPEELRVQRLLARGMALDDIRARIANQAAVGDYAAVADLHITNAGDEQALAREVSTIWEVISNGPTRVPHPAH